MYICYSKTLLKMSWNFQYFLTTIDEKYRVFLNHMVNIIIAFNFLHVDSPQFGLMTQYEPDIGRKITQSLIDLICRYPR